MWVPIQNPQKNPTATEKEALRANHSLYEALKRAQEEWNKSRSEDPADFTAIPIDPTVLDDERQFQVRQRLDQVVMEIDSEEDEEEETDVESFYYHRRGRQLDFWKCHYADYVAFE